MYKNCLFSILILVFGSSSSLNAQNILDFFIGVPDSSVLTLPKSERSKIVRLSKNNRSAKDATAIIKKHGLNYTFENVDVKNGYLKLIGAMEGHLEMCYWNLQSGKKLVGVYHESCGPGCYPETLNFYLYSAGKYTSVPFDKVFPDLHEKIFGSQQKDDFDSAFQTDFKETMTLKLPQKGKNIVVKWGSDEFLAENRQKMKGNQANLIWRDGKFITGQIYWAK